MEDSDLINDFVRTRSESAFRNLVHRHLNLVYAAARRQVRDPALAEDVAQGVFIILARKAHTIRNTAALSGWLLSTTRYVATTANRARTRRTEHESEAAAMQSQMDSPAQSQAWTEMEPAIDAAMSSLPAHDRDVLALRFFQSKSLAEVAAAVGVSEEAARKRVDRALTKLRTFLTGRGMTMSVDTVAAGMAAASHAPSAPAALATTISSSALTSATGAATAGFSFADAAIKTMFWLKLKLAVLIIAACIVPVTVVAVAIPHASDTRTATAPAYVFHGRLIDGKGAPVAGASIEMDASKGIAEEHPKATSDADGRFAVANSLNAKFLLSVTKPGFRGIAHSELAASDSLRTISFPRILTIAGSVTDAQTHQPVTHFSAMTGGAWDAQQRWINRDRAIPSITGRYSLEINWLVPEVWIHIEAPGYQPADSPIYRTEEGAVTADIQLKTAPDVVAKVLLPDGSPAAGATIYVGDARHNSIFIDDALPKPVKGPTSRLSTSTLRTADDGTFSLPPQTGVFQLIAVHERGIGYTFGDPVHASPLTISLMPWGKVHGIVAESLHTKQLQDVNAFMQFAAGAMYQQSRRIGPDGIFSFDHVPPGELSIGIPVMFNRARTTITVIDHMNYLQIMPGQTIETKVGGAAAIVAGRVLLPPSIKGDLASRFVYGQLIAPPAPRLTSRPTTAEAFAARAAAAKSFAVRINDDGTFLVKDVPPGVYRLIVNVQELNEGPSSGSGPAVAQLDKPVQVTLTADRCDLGDLFLEPPPSPKR